MMNDSCMLMIHGDAHMFMTHAMACTCMTVGGPSTGDDAIEPRATGDARRVGGGSASEDGSIENGGVAKMGECNGENGGKEGGKCGFEKECIERGGNGGDSGCGDGCGEGGCKGGKGGRKGVREEGVMDR